MVFCQTGGYAGVQDVYGSCESCTEPPFSGYQPFFDPETSTSGLSSGVTVGGTASSLVQTTGEAAVMREAGNKSATHPVEGPGTDVKQQGQPPSLLRLPVQVLMFCQLVPVVLLYMLSFLVLTVRKNSRVIQDFALMATSLKVPQTSPRTQQLIRNCLKSLHTGRLSEA